jgi:hypothetical protein
MGLTSSRVSRTSGDYQPERRPAQTLVPDRADPLLKPLQCGQDRQVAFGPGVAGIGLPASTPSPTRKVKNWFQVDQHRLMEVLVWEEEKAPKASRIVWADS